MKKAYVTPAVIVHGTVEDITQSWDVLQQSHGRGKRNGKGKGKGKGNGNPDLSGS